MSDDMTNLSNTIGIVNLEELNDSKQVTTVSLNLMEDAVQAAQVLSRGALVEAHIHLVEGQDGDENPAVAFSTDRSGTTAVMVASRVEVGGSNG